MANKKPIDVIRLRQGLIQIQICCNLSPDEMRERKEEVENNYLRDGWRWEISLDNPNFAPVRCDDREGYWHYIAFC